MLPEGQKTTIPALQKKFGSSSINSHLQAPSPISNDQAFLFKQLLLKNAPWVTGPMRTVYKK
jgi:hypothetical protein